MAQAFCHFTVLPARDPHNAVAVRGPTPGIVRLVLYLVAPSPFRSSDDTFAGLGAGSKGIRTAAGSSAGRRSSHTLRTMVSGWYP